MLGAPVAAASPQLNGTAASPPSEGSSTIEALLREKRELEDTLASERAEHAEVFQATQERQQESERRLAAIIEQDKLSKAQLNRQLADLAGERAQLAEQMERDRARLDDEHRELAQMKAELEASLNANTQLISTQQRMAALQDEVEQLRAEAAKLDDVEERARLETQERVSEFAALVGVYEQRQQEDRATIAQLQAALDAAPPKDTKPVEEDDASGRDAAIIAQLRSQVEALNARLAGALSQPADAEAEELRQQVSTYAAELDRLRQQTIEQGRQVAASKSTIQVLQQKIRDKDDELGNIVHGTQLVWRCLFLMLAQIGLGGMTSCSSTPSGCARRPTRKLTRKIR